MVNCSDAVILAMPKSVIFTVPSAATMRLAGLISRCTMPFGVSVIERRRGLGQNAEHALGRNRLAGLEHLIERRPVHVFHGDVGQVALLLHVVDGDDAGVGEDARRARLAKEAFAQAFLLFGLAARSELNGLDGHWAADVGVDGVVHHAHGAAPQFPARFCSALCGPSSSSDSTNERFQMPWDRRSVFVVCQPGVGQTIGFRSLSTRRGTDDRFS